MAQQADTSKSGIYRRNRYYDDKTGRFAQEDPIGIAGGLNAYGFGAGDPVNYRGGLFNYELEDAIGAICVRRCCGSSSGYHPAMMLCSIVVRKRLFGCQPERETLEPFEPIVCM